MEIQKVRSTFKKWYHIEDDRDIDILLAFLLSHGLEGDPVWLIYVGSSSALKTEALRALEIPNLVLHSDKITAHTLISGRKIKKKFRKDVDMAPKLHNKIWMIYDFSQVLTMRQESRNEVLSDMRSLYDGRISKAFGTGQIVEYGSGKRGDPLIHCSLLAASTHAIDKYLIEHRLLGTRYLMYRIADKNRNKTLKKIDETFKRDNQAREECLEAVKSFFKNRQERTTMISRKSLDLIKKCANFVSICRTEVRINQYTNEVEDIAAPEQPARVYKQFRKIFGSAMQLEDYDETMAASLMKKVARSSIPRVRLKIMQLFKEGKDVTAYHVERSLQIGKGYCRRNLESLAHLGILERQDLGSMTTDFGDGVSYKISQKDKTYQEVLT